MATVPFQPLAIASGLTAAPITPGFIRGGAPDARNVVLARSTDRSSYTMVWDCTPGSFEWTYECDETVFILEGSIVLKDAGNAPRRLQAGDAVFFPKGAVVFWEVETHVRKFAVMHDQLPAPLALAMKAHRRFRAIRSAIAAQFGRTMRPAAAPAMVALGAQITA